MNTFIPLVLSVFFVVFADLQVIAEDHTPTTKQETRVELFGYELARNILGDDFITPYEVVEVRDLSYSEAQLAAFENTLPSRKVLEWLGSNDYMLIAGPPTLSLLGVRNINDTLFNSKNDEGGWYATEGEEFSRTDTIGPVWLALRKSVVPNSANKTWDEQQALLGNDERVPNITEVAWGLTTYYEVRGVYLMSNTWVRTFSISKGYRINIGGFDQEGIHIGYWWGNGRLDYIHVLSVRKLSFKQRLNSE